MDLHSLSRIAFNVEFVIILLLSLCFYSCFSDLSPGYALTVLEDFEDDNNIEAIVEDVQDPEDQEVFYPTHEWQVVKPDQAVPRGLHMRLNLQTGKNEAKLLDEKDDVKKQKRIHKSSNVYTKQELKEALAKFKDGIEIQNPETEKTNPRVQIKAFEGGALQKLLVILATEQPISVKKKALFALSSMLRQFPYAQQQFLKLGGLQLLKNVFREKHAESLYIRILIYKGNNTGQNKEKIQQYNQINLLSAIKERGWCTIISNLLELPENDAREKVLKTVSLLITSCRDQFREDQNLHNILNGLRNEYKDLVVDEQNSGEKDGYFSELLKLINDIVDQLK
ncbi:hypothetical protein FKM82_012098 [Ascaphus truei]